jgi:hypothetical protein
MNEMRIFNFRLFSSSSENFCQFQKFLDFPLHLPKGRQRLLSLRTLPCRSHLKLNESPVIFHEGLLITKKNFGVVRFSVKFGVKKFFLE